MKTTLLPRITVSNRQRKIAFDRAALQTFAEHALPLCVREKGHGLTSISQVNVLLISDRRIARLHQRYMQIAGPTDVLTFQHGEIFISVETAQRQARSHRTSLGYELCLYLVHGLLHLAGYDDREPKARHRMHAAQQKVLQQLVRRIEGVNE